MWGKIHNSICVISLEWHHLHLAIKLSRLVRTLLDPIKVLLHLIPVGELCNNQPIRPSEVNVFKNKELVIFI